MKDRLPVNIENLELPKDEFKIPEPRSNSYGYVNILCLLSSLITLASVLAIIFLGSR